MDNKFNIGDRVKLKGGVNPSGVYFNFPENEMVVTLVRYNSVSVLEKEQDLKQEVEFSDLEPVGPTYEPGKWYGWNGGECPVHPENKVIAVIDGRNEFYSGIEPAGNFIWSHSGTADIVAFKIVEEYKPKAEPRDFWVAFDSSGRHYIFTDVPYGWKNHIKVREVIE